MTLSMHGSAVRGDFTVDVALEVPAGRHVIVSGDNGAGKSTVLHAVAGLERFVGDITVDGMSWSDLQPRDRRCGMVFQDIRLFDHLTVLENVSYGLKARGVSSHTAGTTAREWIERVGVSHLEKRRPLRLSGGERQRVAIARALAVQPRVLLLDEPLSAIDAASRPMFGELLRECLDEFQGSALVVVHDSAAFDMPGVQRLVCRDGRLR